LWPRKTDTFSKTKPAGPLVSCVEARGYSMLGGSADVIAASTVPTPASLPSLQEQAPRQLTMATSSGTPAPTNADITADRLPFAYDIKRPGSRSSAEVSTHNLRASYRFFILRQTRTSLRAPVGQPSRFPIATSHQFNYVKRTIVQCQVTLAVNSLPSTPATPSSPRGYVECTPSCSCSQSYGQSRSSTGGVLLHA
jgi:hypothetical protein